jgi:phosphohistidine swiveling domain-containing protein
VQIFLGIPGATGVALGRIRLGGGQVRTGDVLVVDEWDERVRSALPRAAGLVLDAGRTQSEALAAARRYHVPALMLAGAAARLTDGDVVEIDGYAGEIRVLATAERTTAERTTAERTAA